ncbi:MAG: hypothetical protein BMS9Abin04_525 [Planctomycetia bacterium]|nr:MAG: hypothetical protein BMS9Abin04_525 [Planctomycetia bacterium]
MLLFASLANTVMGSLLAVLAIFLILLVLVQRGRGGGLTGALGGMGGQSAFGAKAGDVFTRITIGTAAVWILLCVASVKFLGSHGDSLSGNLGQSTATQRGAAPGPNAVEETPVGGPASELATEPAGPAPEAAGTTRAEGEDGAEQGQK